MIRSVRLPALPAALVRLVLFVLLALAGSVFAEEGLAGPPISPPHQPRVELRAEQRAGWDGAWATVAEAEAEAEPCAEEEGGGADGLPLPAPTTPVRYSYVVAPAFHLLVPPRPPVEVAERAPVPPVVRATPARGPPLAA